MQLTAQQLETNGTLLFQQAELPLSENEWHQLEKLIDEVDHEHVVGGDAGEGHSVWVCRFYNDVTQPEALHARSQELSSIIMSQKMRTLYSHFTGTDQLCLRRCQSNVLREGDYIGIHKDQDSNLDYLATIVFYLSPADVGGEFITHDHSGAKSYRPSKGMALVNNCSIPHEVARIEKGERKTLACFLSTAFGPSNNTRQDFKVAQ